VLKTKTELVIFQLNIAFLTGVFKLNANNTQFCPYGTTSFTTSHFDRLSIALYLRKGATDSIALFITRPFDERSYEETI